MAAGRAGDRRPASLPLSGKSHVPTRHAQSAVRAQTIDELPDTRGPRFHDLRIVPTFDYNSGLSPYLHFGQISPLFIALEALKQGEYGTSRICTRDTDFHRSPLLTVIDPLHS